MSYNNTTNNINPKSCTYGCGLQIFWNASVNEYWEVFTQKKHICPNRVNKPTTSNTSSATDVSTKPTYYNKFTKQPKLKMSNSFELLTGPTVAEIQKKYEILSDIVTEHNG